jgi:hypothetical protein
MLERLGESPFAHLSPEECERLQKKAEFFAAAEQGSETTQAEDTPVPEGASSCRGLLTAETLLL